MSAISQTLRNFRNIWNHGDDEYLDDEDDEYERDTRNAPARNAPAPNTSSTQSRPQADTTSRPDRNPSDRAAFPQNGGNDGGSIDNVRRLRPVSPALRAREKNIYALRPRSQEEAVAAADALKTGDAVIINLEEVPRGEAIRIIDFMSGVCYGLDHQGHAMKLGELIFLYTPGDFEISSDETDYGENNEPFFMDEGDKLSALSRVAIIEPRAVPVVTVATNDGAASQTVSITPNVPAQLAQMQAQAAQTAAELTAAQAQVVSDPQLQAQRDAIRAAQNSHSQSLPSQSLPAQPQSASDNTPFPRAIPSPFGTPSHLTAQGYLSPTAPMRAPDANPNASSNTNVAPPERRPWER